MVLLSGGVCSSVSIPLAMAQEPLQLQVFSAGPVAGGQGTEGEPKAAMSMAIGGPGGQFVFGGNAGMATSINFGTGGNPNNSSALMNLLGNQSIKNELKLSDDQIASAKTIMTESGQRMSSFIRQSMQEGRPLNPSEIKELMAENQKKAETAIEEILLPEQLKRLRQLAYQVEIAQIGLGDSLVEGRLGSEVGVTDQQKEHLAKKAAEIENEARLEIARIRAAAQAKLLAELSAEQRNKATSLLGPYFLFEEPTLQQRIREQMKQSARQATGTATAPK